LIGFDARLHRNLYEAEWPNERRRDYLIDPTVEWPLSVDPDVWPSIFDDPAASTLRRDPLHAILLQPDLGDLRQRHIGLWTRASALRDAIAAAGAAERTVCVAIEVLLENGLERDPDWDIRLGGETPCEPSRVDWARLGFDVADIDYTSGLSNCGWLAEDEQSWKERWLPFMNEHGLLADLGAATDLRAAMDDRAPEHAPFFVYRIATCAWADIG
jgi:hypothetical protein